MIALVHPDPDQPRDDADAGAGREALETMAAGMRARVERGQCPFVQLPTVRRHPDRPAELMIVTGERRYRAARIAGLERFPCIKVSDEADPVGQLVENLQRRDLTPKQTARAVKRLIEDAGMTRADVARQTGLDLTRVGHLLALLDLPPVVDALYERGICRVPWALADLRRAHGIDPGATARFCRRRDGRMTRAQARDFLRALQTAAGDPDLGGPGSSRDGRTSSVPDEKTGADAARTDTTAPADGPDTARTAGTARAGGVSDRDRARTTAASSPTGITVRLHGRPVLLVGITGTAHIVDGVGEPVAVDGALLELDALLR